MKITLAHGSGGKSTSELIDAVFAKYFSNPILNMMEDSAVVDGSSKIAVTTDSFVVTPLVFPGGDISQAVSLRNGERSAYEGRCAEIYYLCLYY